MTTENVIRLYPEQSGASVPEPEQSPEAEDPANEPAAESDWTRSPAEASRSIESTRPPAAEPATSKGRSNWAYWRKRTRRGPPVPLRAGERWKRRLPKVCW
jgi:hypothetical protein